MEKLYAPWRSNYVVSHNNDNECPLCLTASEKNDEKRYIIKRYNHVFVILNLYPYNAGHVMVVPYEHKGSLSELLPEVRAEFIEVTALCEKILKKELKVDGLNIGLNLGGKSAGGTIPEHIHLHILPRFYGDTNFLPLLSDTKQIALDLNGVYKQLKDAFNK
ncbi:MAG: HIT domain-containing protein [Candidatus Babeliaceae bacterium]|nr:HIT domain-containing protein [Candidatus Babeliaceae bacterium]